MIEFAMPPLVASQLDADAVRAKAFVAGLVRASYAYRERDGVMWCDREIVELMAEVLLELGGTAPDRQTQLAAMYAAQAALHALAMDES